MFKKVNEAYNQLLKKQEFDEKIEEEPPDMMYNKNWKAFKQEEEDDSASIYKHRKKPQKNISEPIFAM